MAVQTRSVADVCAAAKEASRTLARLDSATRDAALEAIAAALEARVDEIVEANALDMKAGEEAAIGSALLDRLRLTPERVAGIARGVREIAALRDPVGEGLEEAVMEYATVPVIYAASGNCHVYVDATADLEKARAIVLNAKVQRPGVCNAAESLLVHADVAAEFLPGVLRDLRDAGVELRV